MKLEILNVCDFATVDVSGKLTMVGVFDCLHTASTPMAYGTFCLAVRMRFENTEEGQKKIKLSFVDSDGQQIVPSLEANILVQTPRQESSSTIHFVTTVMQLIFPNFGEYAVNLAVDGRQEGSTPVFVRQLIPNQPGLPISPPNQ